MSLYLGENLISGSKPINLGVRNIGEIFPALLPVTDAGAHLLDGSLILGGGIYQGFVDYIAALYGDGTNIPNYFCTESDWQSSVSTYGVCGKFVYDSTNNTVRLPKVTGIIEGTTDASALGDLVEAGLPNITGDTGWLRNSDEQTGCFKTGTVSKSVFNNNGRTTNYSTHLDASLSSYIYGNSNTVQPQTIKAYYYIVIANSTKTDIQVDIDEVVTDLNGKADTDLSNVTDTGYIKMAGASMPSNRYIDLTLGASGTTYTAPANGYFWITYEASTTSTGALGGWVVFSNMNNGMIMKSWGIYGFGTSNLLPIKKDEVMQMTFGNNPFVSNVYFRFYYAQGSESETQ